jgi:hypothetical protein
VSVRWDISQQRKMNIRKKYVCDYDTLISQKICNIVCKFYFLLGELEWRSAVSSDANCELNSLN